MGESTGRDDDPMFQVARFRQRGRAENGNPVQIRDGPATVTGDEHYKSHCWPD